MRLRWLAALPAAALLAVPACRAPEDATPVTPVPVRLAAAPAVRAPSHLCDALPRAHVAAVTGRTTVAADGVGPQCSWRAPAPHDGTDVVLQGSFIDARSFEVGRPDGTGATTVAGVGDDAYLVRTDAGSPVTLYVRDGNRGLALWLPRPDAAPERTLAPLARRVLEG
jgi:hypothetical protein